MLLLLATQAAIGQTGHDNGTSPWSLDSCMAYAIAHSTAVATQRLEARQAHADQRHAAAAFLPTVSAGVSAQWGWGRGIDPETNTYNNVTTFNNNYGLYASMTLFDGGRTINAFRQARLLRRSAAAATAKASDNKAIEVMQCFIDAAYAQMSVGIAERKLSDSRQLLHRTRRMMELGTKSRPDVALAEAEVAADDYDLTHQTNEARRTLLALKAAMNFPADSALAVDTTCQAVPHTVGDAEPEAMYAAFAGQSPEVVTAMAATKSARLAWLQQRGALMPTLSLEGGISTNYYKNLTTGAQAEAFAHQMRNNRGEYLGLNLSIPIFNSSAWRAARRAKTNWQKSQMQLDETRRLLHDNMCQAVMDRDGYAKEIVQMERKVASDSLAHHLNSRKFEEGMLNVFELNTSAQALLQSRVRLLQMRMLYVMKQRLVEYYKGENLIR